MAEHIVKNVKLYTDGACSGNPGRGGYGVVLLYNSHRKELSGGFRRTTNNRMEMLAVIKGLEALKTRCEATIYTDSQYIFNAITKGWAKRWQANNWKRNRNEPVINPDLWVKILGLCDFHRVRFEWVRGHAGNVENEAADQLAVAAANLPRLETDTYYEQYGGGKK